MKHEPYHTNGREDLIEDLQNMTITLLLLASGFAGCYQMRTMKYSPTDPATSTTRIAQESPLTEKDFLFK
jgi:hypothetical protein